MSKAKTQTRIDSIPPELCTVAEAEEILGVKHFLVMRNSQRFSRLRHAEVIYRGSRILLFNKEEVKSLRYKPCPEGYISSKEAANIFGLTVLHAELVKHLENHGVRNQTVKAHHSYRVWKRSEIEAFARIYNKKPDSRLWLTTEKAAKLLCMSWASVHRFARQGMLKKKKVGSVCYFSKDSVEKLIESRK